MNANNGITLLWSFSQSELISICEGLGLPSFGERGDLIKTILAEYSAEDIGRMGLNKKNIVKSSITSQNKSNVGCITCGK